MTATRALTVSLPTELTDGGAHRAVLASVPDRFRIVDDRDADVVAVDGHRPDWMSAVDRAVHGSCRAVMVIGVGLGPAADVEALAATLDDRIVAISSPYSTSAGWVPVAADIRHDISDGTAALVDSCVTSMRRADEAADEADEADDERILRRGLVEQIAITRSLQLGVEGLSVSMHTSAHYVLAGVVGGVTVTLAGVVSSRPQHTLAVDVVGAARRWRVRLHADAPAEPADISSHDDRGIQRPWPAYESGHRVAWAQLHRAVRLAGPVAYPLGDLAADLRVAESWFGVHPAE